MDNSFEDLLLSVFFAASGVFRTTCSDLGGRTGTDQFWQRGRYPLAVPTVTWNFFVFLQGLPPTPQAGDHTAQYSDFPLWVTHPS